jgi:hypothetical protein
MISNIGGALEVITSDDRNADKRMKKIVGSHCNQNIANTFRIFGIRIIDFIIVYIIIHLLFLLNPSYPESVKNKLLVGIFPLMVIIYLIFKKNYYQTVKSNAVLQFLFLISLYCLYQMK